MEGSNQAIGGLTAAEWALFRLCTVITVGNGNKTSFWKDWWLNGCAPQDIAPKCYKLAWRKNHTVATTLRTRRWMRGLRQINSEEGLLQFVDLWLQLSQVRLTSEEDSISWRFTTYGCYTAESAYNVQFQGAIRDGSWNTVWKAWVENKCRFFIWLLLQAKLSATDRISNHGGQANNSCPLCYTNAESHLHMGVRCSYTRAVWQHIATRFSIPQPPQQSRTLRR
jgi:hypothetical protein